MAREMAAECSQNIRGKLGVFIFLTACLNTLHFRFRIFSYNFLILKILGWKCKDIYHILGPWPWGWEHRMEEGDGGGK